MASLAFASTPVGAGDVGVMGVGVGVGALGEDAELLTLLPAAAAVAAAASSSAAAAAAAAADPAFGCGSCDLAPAELDLAPPPPPPCCC